MIDTKCSAGVRMRDDDDDDDDDGDDDNDTDAVKLFWNINNIVTTAA